MREPVRRYRCSVWYENFISGEIKYMGVYDSGQSIFINENYFWDYILTTMRNRFNTGSFGTDYEISSGPISHLPFEPII